MRIEEITKGIKALKTLDRRTLYSYVICISIVLILILFGQRLLKKYYRVGRLVAAKKAELKAFDKLKKEYMENKGAVDHLDKKLFSPRGVGSPMTLLEEIGKRIGIRDNITTFKPLGEKAKKDYVEKGVEVKIEGINLNELVNFLYKIENHRALFIIKDFSMKSRFDNPDLLDVSLNVALANKVGK